MLLSLFGLHSAMRYDVLPSVSAVHVPSPVVWNDWVVHWEVTPSDGIRIYNVTYNGALFLRDARVPGVIVQYFGSTCFFYDEFLSNWIPHNQIFLEDPDRGVLDPSDQAFQIRADVDVYGYDYHQIWRFDADGRFWALVEVGGGGCFARHVYEVRWRFDFAIGNDIRNTFYQYANGGWVPVRQEGESVDNGERDPSTTFTNWKVSAGKRAFYFTAFDTPQPSWVPGVALTVQDHLNEIEHSHTPGIVTPYIYRGIVVYDADGDSVYDSGETAMVGASPVAGTALEDDPKVRYIDSSGSGLREPGERVVYDSNSNGKYDAGEPVLMGSSMGVAPSPGTVLLDDPLLKCTPGESVWRRDLAVWYLSRHYHDPFEGVRFDIPILTGLIFYPYGF